MQFTNVAIILPMVSLLVVANCYPRYNSRLTPLWENSNGESSPPEMLDNFWDKNAKQQISELDNNLAKIRTKRLSDQRLAELETLLALSKLCRLPRGGIHIDTTKIGRRRRSIGLQSLNGIVR